MMGEQVCRIERLTNGFTVEIPDAEIQKSNANSKNPWKDPYKKYAFASTKEVAAFITKHLDGLKAPKDDMATNFDRAVKEKS